MSEDVKKNGDTVNAPDPVAEEVAEPAVNNDAPCANASPKEPDPPAVSNADVSPEEFIQRLPEQYQEVLSNGLDLLKREKTKLVASIVNASGNQFTECELASKSIGELTKISALIQKPSSDGPVYVGNAGVPVDNAAEVEPLPLPSLADVFSKK